MDSGMLQKNTPVPLYYQLKQHLLARMKAGELKAGDRLPTENELCRQLEISRPTVRQALGELVQEGYLVRRKGKGTFVCPAPVTGRFFQRLQSFHEEMEQKGLHPATRVLRCEKLDSRYEIAAELGLPAGDALLHIKRLRLADGRPLVVVDTYLPYTAFGWLMQENLERESLYDLLEGKGTRVDRVTRIMEAVNVSAEDARLLQMGKDKAVCLVKSLASAGGVPVEYSIARYRGDQNKFAVELLR
ncbi:MAG: GntR family transcriptional regulator [Eubacteriales bacterium]|nr:GntR family transcriptional regulator [Eubacteriales bacterium]